MAADTIASGMPSRFRVSQVASTSMKLEWIASGDDGNEGTVGGYGVLYGTSPNMEVADTVETDIFLGPAGTPETYILSGLLPRTAYYVGLRAVDKARNRSQTAFAGALTKNAFFYDDVESAPKFLAYDTSGFGLTTEEAHSGTHSYASSPRTYAISNSYEELRLRDPLQISAPGYLIFWAKTGLEPGNSFLSEPPPAERWLQEGPRRGPSE
jgi:hypothetical protein